MKAAPNLVRFYVYVLFDWQGIPRYIGKGKGGRWLEHERYPDPNNWLKNIFVTRTQALLGEVPKVKIAEHLTEPQAFEIEAVLIKAVGRYPNGPLTNLTDNRNGPSSETIAAWHAGRTPEERAARMRPAIEASVLARKLYTPEQRKAQIKAALTALTPEHHLAAAVRINAGYTPEKRAAAMRKRAAGMTPEKLSATSLKIWKSRRKNGNGLKFSPAQLSEFGKKGVATANANRTPEERRALARKAGLASYAAKLKRDQAT